MVRWSCSLGDALTAGRLTSRSPSSSSLSATSAGSHTLVGEETLSSSLPSTLPYALNPALALSSTLPLPCPELCPSPALNPALTLL